MIAINVFYKKKRWKRGNHQTKGKKEGKIPQPNKPEEWGDMSIMH
jgi:hypothetical protein